MKQIYVMIGNQQSGPFPQEVIKAMLESGQITMDTMAWQEGMDNWAPLYTIYAATPAPRCNCKKYGIIAGIVLGSVAVLTGIVLAVIFWIVPMFNGSSSIMTSDCDKNMKDIYSALESFYKEHHRYPGSLQELAKKDDSISKANTDCPDNNDGSFLDGCYEYTPPESLSDSYTVVIKCKLHNRELRADGHIEAF